MFKSTKLGLSDPSKKFRNMCNKMYILDTGIFWQHMATSFQQTKAELELLTEIKILLIKSR